MGPTSGNDESPLPGRLTGRLVLVGTPIGNLGDLSDRAIAALAGADLVACEDTRRTGRLLAHAGVPKRPLCVVNEHTERDAVRRVRRELDEGHQVVLVSDAGMPAVSDPGQLLVAAVIEAGHEVSVVPGPSASLAALVVSGLPTRRFVFEGFLPRKGGERQRRLVALADEARTIVLYEAPHRLARTLADLAEVLGGDRPVAIARELTKLHEELWRGSLDEALAWAASPVRGEIVVIVDGRSTPSEVTDDDIVAALRGELDGGASTRDAVAAVVEGLGVTRRRVYPRAVELREPR